MWHHFISTIATEHTMIAPPKLRRLEYLLNSMELCAGSGENLTKSGHSFLEHYHLQKIFHSSFSTSVWFQPTGNVSGLHVRKDSAGIITCITLQLLHMTCLNYFIYTQHLKEVWLHSPHTDSCWERRANEWFSVREDGTEMTTSHTYANHPAFN